MKKVLVYRSGLLALSETFIKEQMLAYRRWHGILVGMRRVPAGLDLDGLDVLLLRPAHPGVLNRISWKLSRIFGTLPPHVLGRLRGASLVHAHFGTDALEAWLLAQALDLPMLVTLHGYDINIYREWWEAGHHGDDVRDYPTRLMELAGQPRVQFVAVSKAIRQRAISFGIPEDKVTVRYIGVDPAKFTSGRPAAERERRVLFVGRLVEKKGCEYLIEAFARVQKEVPGAQLIIIGDGELRAGLQQLAAHHGVSAEFRGARTNVEVRQEFALARAFCLPSVTASNGDAEGLPIVLLEALASGTPVVTSARGGVEEVVIDGLTGFAFRERDVATMAASLIKILSDDGVAGRMAAEGLRFVSKNFDINNCTETLELLYEDVVKLQDSERS
jgi:glycosyltransferase involved in cell wall biosynthesis